MLTIGLDVHQGATAVCILDQNGERVKRFTHHGHPSELADVLGQLDEPFRVGFEASCGSGTLHDILTPIARHVVVAHPGHLRLIFKSKKKNDRVDAEKIALVATSHYLARVMLAMLQTGEVWREEAEMARRRRANG